MDYSLDNNAATCVPGGRQASSSMSADKSDQALWAAVVLQAKQDVEAEPLDSNEYAQAVYFFTGRGEWAEARSTIADFLNMHPDDIEACGRRYINQRRSAEGLPPLSPRSVLVSKAAKVPAVPRPRVVPPAVVLQSKPEVEPVRVTKTVAAQPFGKQAGTQRRPYIRRTKMPRVHNPFFPNGVFPIASLEARQTAA